MKTNSLIEVRTKRNYDSLRSQATGSKITTRYDFDKLVQYRYSLALEQAQDDGIKVTKAMQERWLKAIRTDVAAFIMRKELS